MRITADMIEDIVLKLEIAGLFPPNTKCEVVRENIIGLYTIIGHVAPNQDSIGNEFLDALRARFSFTRLSIMLSKDESVFSSTEPHLVVVLRGIPGKTLVAMIEWD